MDPGPSSQRMTGGVPRVVTRAPIPPTFFRFQSVKNNGEKEIHIQQDPYHNHHHHHHQQYHPHHQNGNFNNGNGNGNIDERFGGYPRNHQNLATGKQAPTIRKEVHVQQHMPQPVPSPNQNHEFHQFVDNNSTSSSLPSTSYAEAPEIGQHHYTIASNGDSGGPATSQQQPVFIEHEGGRIQEVCEEKVPTTIELPSNCKLFQYSWVGPGGIRRVILIPMPYNATEEDVKAMLPQSLDLDESMFQDKSRDELPTLQYPHGMSIETPQNCVQQEILHEKRQDPILVNPKQFHRIMRRRQMRQSLELSGRLPLQRQKYLHESRHLHALKRKRGIDGRFDTKLTGGETTSPETSGATPPPPKYVAQTMQRTVTTYAEIRPAMDGATSSYHHNPYAPLNNLHQEPITSYQQYQQHVQYPQPTDHEKSTEEPQKFTNL